jgi:hypothetical protein
MTVKPIELPEPTHTEYQGWDKWAEKFKPTLNHFHSDNDEHMYETYGAEVEYVIEQDSRHIWTWIQGDMSDLIVAGYHYVNRLGYYITEVPWEDEYDYALLSVEVECECYSEDEDVMDSRHGEFGDVNCPECEGYGRVTKYVD